MEWNAIERTITDQFAIIMSFYINTEFYISIFQIVKRLKATIVTSKIDYILSSVHVETVDHLLHRASERRLGSSDLSILPVLWSRWSVPGTSDPQTGPFFSHCVQMVIYVNCGIFYTAYGEIETRY